MAIKLNLESLTGADIAPLHMQYPGQHTPQPAFVQFDEDGSVSAYVSGEIGNGQPMRVWHQRDLRWAVPGNVNGQALADLLAGAALPLLERVHAGHSVDWDGNNYSGTLDDDATEASDALEQMFDGMQGDESAMVPIWDVSDWLFSNCILSDHWSDQAIEDAAAQLEAAADSEGVYLDGDIAACLLDQAEQMFDEDGDDKLTATHLAALVADGRITQEQADARNGDEAED